MGRAFLEFFKYAYRVAVGAVAGLGVYSAARFFGLSESMALAATISASVFLLMLALIEAVGTAVDSLHPKIDKMADALETLERADRERTGRLF